ncbi:retinol dehydrogenase 12-like [Phlebotomus papatasi]|uniref:retinol dehydrogenase 12-like n=1 Tax=Phlebotomus papatasi TaxID=29031 RepID=UPI002483B753|nr:retinol dehydrogenase 12-like [Phlebotomus papatasi]
MELSDFFQYINLLRESISLKICILGSMIAVVIVVILLFRNFVMGGQFRKDYITMDEKVVVITGANSGIGKETALDLARRNAKIYLACRDYDRCELARKEIIQATGNTKIYNRHLDLNTLDSVREFVEEFSTDEKHLDVLINNAGVLYIPHSITKDGCETTLQVNHISHFLLSHLLLGHLKRAPQGRIINISSIAYILSRIDKDDLHLNKSFGMMRAYANSKLAQILTTQRLAQELKGTNVTVNVVHPGIISTDIWRNVPFIPWPFSWIISFAINLLIYKSVTSGAQTQIRCAVDPKLATVSGKFFSACKEVHPIFIFPQAKNKNTREFIWRESLRLAKIPIDFSYK